MRRAFVTVIALSLIAGVLLASMAHAGRKRSKEVKTTRTASAEYVATGGAVLPVGTASICVNTEHCIGFPAEAREQYVSLEVADATGTPAPFLVSLGGGGSDAIYCGETPTPVWLNGAHMVRVQLVSLALPDCSGAGTTGTLTATFSNLP